MAMIKNSDTDRILNQYKEQTMIFQKNDNIIQSGKAFEGVYLVNNGVVKISRPGINKNNFLLWFAEPGEIVGLQSYFNKNDNYPFSVTAATDNCKVSFITTANFNELLKKSPQVKKELMRVLVERINFMEGRFTSILRKKTKERLAEILLFFFLKRKNKKEKNPETLDYSTHDLADIIGTSESYLNKVLSEFQHQQFIVRKRNKLKIENPEGLYAITEGR